MLDTDGAHRTCFGVIWICLGESYLFFKGKARILEHPRAQMTSIFEGSTLQKKAQTPIKTRVIWLLGKYGGFLKWWYPQIVHFIRDFHYKSSILGYHCHYFRKPPYKCCKLFIHQVIQAVTMANPLPGGDTKSHLKGVTFSPSQQKFTKTCQEYVVHFIFDV